MSEQGKSLIERIPTGILLLAPLALLAAVIWIFLNTGAGVDLEAPAPIEELSIERVILTKPPQDEWGIEVIVRNSSPEAVTIAQVAVNDGMRPFSISPEASIPRLGTASIYIPYGWVEGEAYEVLLFTSNAIIVPVEIPVASETVHFSGESLLAFALIGLYVGVIPVFLGILWFPALRRLDKRWMTFLMALTIGLLVFLGVDTVIEALEQAEAAPSAFQGIGLATIGAVGIFLLLDAIGSRQEATGRDASDKRLSVAYLIALGIGLHNLGEGLAIGAAYNVGEIALGTFLVVGFIIQNITEGLGIIAPVLRDRPAIRHLLWMGVIGGAPAILGAWLGAYSPSPTLAVLFFGVGAGAIFEVVYEIAKMLRRDKKLESMMVFWGVLAGMGLLWVTGLLIK